MSTSFGQSHRQIVKDANEGVVSAPEAAPESSVGIKAIRGRRNDVHRIVENNDDSAQLATALVEAAGQIGANIVRERQRRAAIEGYNKAGTEEGRREVDKVSGHWANQLFGPDTSLRASQERIVKDSVDRQYIKLQADLKEFGHSMSDEEWDNHVLGALDESTDKYEDDGIRDMITQRFGENMTALQRDYVKESTLFKQAEARETFINSVESSVAVAQADLESGDYHRAGDAYKRMQDALVKPEGMSKPAYQTAIADVLKGEMNEGRDGLFKVATEQGIVKDMPFETRQELMNAKQLYDTKFERDAVEASVELDKLVMTGDVPAVVAYAETLQKKYPSMFDSGGVNAYIEKAMEAKAKIMYEKRQETIRMTKALAGDPSLSRESKEDQQAAVNAATNYRVDNMMRDEAKAGAQRNGEEMQGNWQPTPAQRSEWMLANPEKWADTWAMNNVETSQVSMLARTVMYNIGNPDITEAKAAQLKDGLDALNVLREKNPALFAKQFDNDEQLASFVEYQQQMAVEGVSPYEVVASITSRKQRERQGLNTVPTPENTQSAVKEIGTVLKGAKGEWGIWEVPGAIVASAAHVAASMIPFTDSTLEGTAKVWNEAVAKDPLQKQDMDAVAKRLYEEEFAKTGDHKTAVAVATARMQRDSTIYGTQYIVGGARIDEATYGGSFDKFMLGLNDDPATRAKLVDQYKLDVDTDLRGSAVGVIPNGDYTGVTLRVPRRDGTVAFVPVHLPTREDQVLKSNTEKFWEARKADLKSGIDATTDLFRQAAGIPTVE